MPAADLSHPLASALMLRTLRLNCLTKAFADLWQGLFNEAWHDERWVVDWMTSTDLNGMGRQWEPTTALRAEVDRRAALVETDALVAVWLGIGAGELVNMYRSRYAILAERETETYFDAKGRKIAQDSYAFGFGQTKEHYEQLQAHLNDEQHVPPPPGYEPRFHRVDRAAEYEKAHAAFSKRLQDAIDAGWRPE